MKITPQPTGIGELEINDALAYVDDFHREALGLDFLYDGCSISPSVESFESEAPRARVILIDSRAEVLRRFLAWIEHLPEIVQYIGFVFPKTHSGITDWLVEQEELQQFSIRDYVITHQVIYLEFGPQQSGDLDARSVFAGVKFGLSISEAELSEQPENLDELQELRSQLISVLESIELIDTETPPGEEIEESLLQTEEPTPNEHKEHIAVLEGRVVTLQGKLDALQRKYDSLASSTLGKITLNRWNKKRDKHS